MDPLLILFGLGVGILVGTTGMGGGSLMTPLLPGVVLVAAPLALGVVAYVVHRARAPRPRPAAADSR